MRYLAAIVGCGALIVGAWLSPVPLTQTGRPLTLDSIRVITPAMGGATTARASRARATSPLYISDLSFADDRHGWALGTTDACTGRIPCALALRTTDDGGRTWHALPAPPTPSCAGTASNPRCVDHLRFATPRDGWAFGPGLFVTHDGGRTWTAARRFGAVEAIAPAAGTVWLMARLCAAAARCRPTLFISADAGRTWRAAAAQPPVCAVGQVVRAGRGTAWIAGAPLESCPPDPDRFSPFAPGAETFAALSPGAPWRTVATPCDRSNPFSRRLASPQAPLLWLLCGNEPGTGRQGKVLYASHDAGRHWRLVASTCVGELRPPTGCGGLPSSGYIAGVVMTTPARGWLTLERGTLYGTTDGGRTWRPALPYAVASPDAGGVGPLVFADPQHGWLAADAGRVFRTTDGGGRWTPVALP